MQAAGDVHVKEKAAIGLGQNWPMMDQGPALSSLRGLTRSLHSMSNTGHSPCLPREERAQHSAWTLSPRSLSAGSRMTKALLQ